MRHAGVRLEHVLVERVAQAPIDAVRAEVVHGEGEHRVREEVLPGAVGRWREARALEREAEDDRVEVRQVRRHVDHRADLGEASNVLARPLHVDALVERREIERVVEVAEGRARRQEHAEERGGGARASLYTLGRSSRPRPTRTAARASRP